MNNRYREEEKLEQDNIIKELKEERKKLPYKIWLDAQDPKDGFGPTKKAAPTKGLIGLIYNHFADWYESTSLQSYVKNFLTVKLCKNIKCLTLNNWLLFLIKTFTIKHGRKKIR